MCKDSKAEGRTSMSAVTGKAVKRSTERRMRRHPRYRCEFPVTLTLFSGDRHETLSAHCRDLSEAGIGILVASDLQLGEVVSLTFLLPGLARSWETRAVLRHRRGYHYGFEFLSISPQENKMLKSYLPVLNRADDET